MINRLYGGMLTWLTSAVAKDFGVKTACTVVGASRLYPKQYFDLHFCQSIANVSLRVRYFAGPYDDGVF